MQELRKNISCGKIYPIRGVLPKAEKKIVSVGTISTFLAFIIHIRVNNLNLSIFFWDVRIKSPCYEFYL